MNPLAKAPVLPEAVAQQANRPPGELTKVLKPGMALSSEK